MRARIAHTIYELLIALSFCAILSALAAPRLGQGRRVLAVRAAANELSSLTALARATAIASHGASLVIDTHAGVAWIEAHGRVPERRHIAARYHVSIESDRASPVRIRYDGIGVGRFATATIRVRSGSATATLTVSSYGRVRS